MYLRGLPCHAAQRNKGRRGVGEGDVKDTCLPAHNRQSGGSWAGPIPPRAKPQQHPHKAPQQHGGTCQSSTTASVEYVQTGHRAPVRLLCGASLCGIPLQRSRPHSS